MAPVVPRGSVAVTEGVPEEAEGAAAGQGPWQHSASIWRPFASKLLELGVSIWLVPSRRMQTQWSFPIIERYGNVGLQCFQIEVILTTVLAFGVCVTYTNGPAAHS